MNSLDKELDQWRAIQTFIGMVWIAVLERIRRFGRTAFLTRMQLYCEILFIVLRWYTWERQFFNVKS